MNFYGLLSLLLVWSGATSFIYLLSGKLTPGDLGFVAVIALVLSYWLSEMIINKEEK
ncbi:MAG: hypothetical protein UT05_C0009G0024 [Parcubacteria group bacterium GW2011_GWF2_38_76]|nr:MAG: hypothetical protein UT05_C0009G0024 [Parcubacteria group bacterium GW2011_GWF2_38_76]